MRRDAVIDTRQINLEDRVIEKGINRTAKVVKGGRRFSFAAIVISGNREGVAGFGFAKANDVPGAVEKATRKAHASLVRIKVTDGTLPHPVQGRFGASKIVLIPAVPGTGIVAGSCVRAVVELAGVRNMLSKSIGRNNPVNLVKATFDALRKLRTREEATRLRGVPLE